MGTAFQVAGDLIDVVGTEVEQAGKAVGKRIEAGKATLVSIYGVEAKAECARTAEARRWQWPATARRPSGWRVCRRSSWTARAVVSVPSTACSPRSTPEDLRRFSLKDLRQIADELRAETNAVSVTGGHLSADTGVIG